MGGKDPNRQPKLSSLRDTPEGWIRLATCTRCGRKATLPIEALIKKNGELAMIEFAMLDLTCRACGNRGATASMVRLCDPSCPRRTVGGNQLAAE